MSTSAQAKNAAESSRRPSTTSSANFRAPSSRVTAKERPFSSGEVIPEDSASNAPSRGSVSEAQKANGSSRAVSERQIGRVHLATRDNLQVRTRSPVKISSGDGPGERGPTERFPVRPSSRTPEGQTLAPKNGKKTLRELSSSLGEASLDGADDASS